MGLLAKISSRMARKPLTEAELHRIMEAAAAKEDLNDLKSATKSGSGGGRGQVERQLGALARRAR